MRWGVIQAKVKQEEVAVINLMRQGFPVFRPMLREHLARGEVRVSPMFPRYLFLGLVGTEFGDGAAEGTLRWLSAANTRGVSKIFRAAEYRPSLLPVGWVEELQQVGELVDVFSTGTCFSKGEQVEFMEGPFRGHQGICQWASEKRVALLLNVLGREACVYAEPGMLRSLQLVSRGAAGQPS